MSDDGSIVDQRIVNSSFTRHVLVYANAKTGEARVVEPHAYGVTTDGHHALLSWRWPAAARARN